MPVVLVKYVNPCSRNVTGNKELYMAAAADITSVTASGTPLEVTAITGALGFVPVGFEQDSYTFTQNSPETKNQIMYEKKHQFKIGKLAKANTTFIDLLSDNLNCGFLTIRGDNNGSYWLSGWSAAETLSRPYKTMGINMDSGKEPGEADKNIDEIVLSLKCGYRDIPFNAALTTGLAEKNGTTCPFVNFA